MAPPAASGWRAALIGAVSNASVQYNLQALSIALAFMKSDYPQPGWVKNTVLGAVFAGAIVGMTGMGALGDVIGRRRAMLLTLSLVVLGSLATALLSWGSALYPVVSAFRFIIGVGVGGIYPLAAATAAESEQAGDAATQTEAEKEAEAAALVKRVGWAFFWQTPGSMLPYVVAWALLALPSSTSDLTSVQFRLILGLGALPAAIVWYTSFRSTESAAYSKLAAAGDTDDGGAAAAPPDEPAATWSEALALHRPYLATLAGTGGTWLLFDVAFYVSRVAPSCVGLVALCRGGAVITRAVFPLHP